MDAALQKLVRERARFRCEYCLLPEALVSTPFQFDRIIAQFHDGPTVAENLAHACFHCNNFIGPNVAGVDPATDEIIRLFHPRRDGRAELFGQNQTARSAGVRPGPSEPKESGPRLVFSLRPPDRRVRSIRGLGIN